MIIGDPMKNKKGFTLIELLAVVALIALISLVVVPSVINIVNKNKPKLSSTTEKLILSAAEMYLDANQTEFIKAKDAVYCPTVQDLVDNGFLEESLIDIETGEEFERTLIVQSSYTGYKYEYEIVKSEVGCVVNYPDTSKAYIVINNLVFSRSGVTKSKIYSNVETSMKVSITTNKLVDGTELTLKIRRGSSYASGFTITGGIVNSNTAQFNIVVPKSAKVGEYVIEVTGGDAAKATKNFKIYINPIILFMGD